MPPLDAPLRTPGASLHVRLRDRRRGLGRLRARGTALGGPGRERPAARGGAAGRQREHPRPARLPAAARAPSVDWDYVTRAGAELRRPPHPAAARQGARRLLLDQRDGLHPRQPRATTTTGAIARLGLGRPASPTSSRPRTTSAAPPSGTAPAGRCRSPSSAPATASRRPWSRRPSRPAWPRNEDFNGAEQDGVGMYQVTQRGGMRASAAVAYLHPAMARAEPDRDAATCTSTGCCSRARARSASRPSQLGAACRSCAPSAR